MFQEKRKLIIKYSLIKVTVSLTIAIGIIIGSKFAPIKYLNGSTLIDINNVDLDKYEGEYVEVKIKPVFDCFLEEERYTEFYNGSRTPDKLSGRYYITAYNEAYHLAIRADSEDFMNILDNRMEATRNNSWHTFEDITLKGTVSKMDSEEFYHFESYLVDSMAIPSDQIENHILIVDKVGPCSYIFLIICSVVAIIALLYAVFHTIQGISWKYMSQVKRFARKNKVSIQSIEEDVSELTFYNLCVGSKYIAYLKRDKIRISSISDYIWAYQRQTKHRNNGFVTAILRKLEMFDRNGKSIIIAETTEGSINNTLKKFMDTQPHMVIGYNDQLKRLYQTNIKEFMRIPYQKKN